MLYKAKYTYLIKDRENIMKNLYPFYENLFSNNVPVYNKSISHFLIDINLQKLFIKQRELRELTEKAVKDVVNKIENNKTLANDVLTKNFLKLFCLKSKIHFFIFRNRVFN